MFCVIRKACVLLLFVNNACGFFFFDGVFEDLSTMLSSSWGEINKELQSNSTEAFLLTFESQFERDTLYEQLAACPFVRLCEFSLDVKYIEHSPEKTLCCKPCDCDFPNCLQDNSCCLDVIYRNAMYHNATLGQDTDAVAEDQDDGAPIERCTPVTIPMLDLLYEPSHVMMIASCPVETSEQLAYNCSREIVSDMRSFKDFVPVYDNSTNIQYKNVYCAQCNNVTTKNLGQASIKLICSKMEGLLSGNDIIDYVTTTEDCTIVMRFPSETTYQTCLNTESTCNSTGQWLNFDPDLEKACSMYRSPILIGDVLYHNIHCAMCNGVDGTNETECVSMGSSMFFSDFSFSGLLKLDSTSELMYSSQNDQCSIDQMYDNLNDVCRDLHCPPHKSLQGGRCLDIFITVEDVIYDLYMKIIPHQTLSVLASNTVSRDVIVAVQNLFRDQDNCGFTFIYKTEAGDINELKNSKLKYFVVRLSIVEHNAHEIDQFVTKALSLNGLEFDIWHYEEDSEQMKAIKMELQVFDYDYSPFDVLDNYTLVGEFLNTVDREGDFAGYMEQATEKFGGHGLTKGLQFPDVISARQCWYKFPRVNVLEMLQCAKIKLSTSDVEWEYSDNGLRLVDGDFKFEISDFYFESEETVVICSDLYKTYMSYMYRRTVEANTSVIPVDTIVSVVCTCVSIICLACTLLVFCMLPKLRQSLPGINHICLVVALLCAQSMYLVIGIVAFESGSTTCIVIGIVLHFTWLLSILWMNVCTYHMFSVLTNSIIVSKDPGTCRVGLYHVYALVMSSIPVCVNIAVSLSTSGSYGYGDTACYISSQAMVTYTFGVPVAVFTLANICMYIYVVARLSMVKQVRKNVKNERNNLMIFVKLSTITGMAWIFGIVFSWTELTVFSYLFIVFNASQGVFIMWAFVCNRRVVNMLKTDVLGYSATSSGQSNPNDKPIDRPENDKDNTQETKP